MAKSKVAKKEWYPILAPKLFRNGVLGETHVYEPEKIMGKRLKQNLMNLTNDVKKQGINVSFEVTSVEKDRALTEIIGYKMVQSSIRRFVRRNVGKIDMSFTCSTSDKKKLRIKPLIVTRMAVVGSIATKIRKNAKDYLIKHIGNSTYDVFVGDLINHSLQGTLKKHLSKVYPLRICEIRSMEVISITPHSETEEEAQKNMIKQTEEKQDTEAKKQESKEAVEKPVEAA
jgi:ribosomal protein S3AE|tara:strand:+ start:92 stop:778 length:687 start_codon:yes stop_codon:yes gene_type:complete